MEAKAGSSQNQVRDKDVNEQEGAKFQVGEEVLAWNRGLIYEAKVDPPLLPTHFASLGDVLGEEDQDAV